jgi:hypothetical protein
MSTPNQPPLCRLYRSLNLRLETFLDEGWRYPTSLDYTSNWESGLDVTPLLEESYATNERLEHDQDYADEELGIRLKSPDPKCLHLADGSSRPLYKSKLLGTPGCIEGNASKCLI